MEGSATFWMCLLVVLYVCNLKSVNANLREKFPINGNDFKKIKLINEDIIAMKMTLDDQQLRPSPCPPAEDIAPCICAVDLHNGGLNLNCDAVESEQQLAAVFQQEFPIKNFITFQIHGNSNIENLLDIFNGVTFEYIDLRYMNNLKFINDNFLSGSADTLKGIIIEDAPLLTADYFPFATMEHYSQLQSLELQDIPIGFIPKIRSQSLTRLWCYTNDITSLEPGFLTGAPNVADLTVSSNMINALSNGTFAIPEQETEIYMTYNGLQRIQPGAFYFANEAGLKSGSLVTYILNYNDLVRLEAGLLKLRNGYTRIYLYSNSINVIEKGAFELPAITDNLGIYIDLSSNDFTTIDENVFGELMPFVTHLDFNDNPLSCGCDILWLISNPVYMTALYYRTACADGTLVVDLDLQHYEELCS